MLLSVSSRAFSPAIVIPCGSLSLVKLLRMSLTKLTYFISSSLALIFSPGVFAEVCNQRNPEKLRKHDPLLESR